MKGYKVLQRLCSKEDNEEKQLALLTTLFVYVGYPGIHKDLNSLEKVLRIVSDKLDELLETDLPNSMVENLYGVTE